MEGIRLHRLGFDENHALFRQGFRRFLEQEVVPYNEKWETDGVVNRDLFRRAGEAGYLAFDAPERYGGGGSDDFRFNAIMAEEAASLGVYPALTGISVHNDVCLPYFLKATNDEQRARWLPGICSGDIVTAVAMTEPTTGSDLSAIRTTAIRDGNDYVLNGSKMFTSNAFNCDLVIVVCKTNPRERHAGISLIAVEKTRAGLTLGRNLSKVGQHCADTGELFFDEVRVPVENRLGAEGEGFSQLVARLPQERLSISVAAVAQAEAAFQLGLEYAKTREAFGKPVGSFQHNRFSLAEMRTEIDIGRVFVDRQLEALNEGILTAETAAEAKWWTTEMCNRVVDRCLQLHGGYGYMEEYPIARLYRDVRVMTIYGGTTEIMKEIVGRSLGV